MGEFSAMGWLLSTQATGQPLRPVSGRGAPGQLSKPLREQTEVAAVEVLVHSVARVRIIQELFPQPLVQGAELGVSDPRIEMVLTVIVETVHAQCARLPSAPGNRPQHEGVVRRTVLAKGSSGLGEFGDHA